MCRTIHKIALITNLTQQLANNFNYSTSERVVGKWTDGVKDVYEKTYSDNNSHNATYVIDSSLTTANIQPIGISGYALMGDTFMPLPFFSVNSSNTRFVINPTVGPNGVSVVINNTTIDKICFTLRYLKIS